MFTTRHTAFSLLVGTAIFGCKERDKPSSPMRLESPFSVIQISPKSDPLEEPPYPHMWYYRTEVRNDSNRELRVIWFEAYVELDGLWYPGNALGKVLRSKEFSLWYAEGDPIVDGVIPPGKTAVCDVNWHGTQTNSPLRTKWAYIAVDEFGLDYFVESEVSSDILKHVHQDLPSTENFPSKPRESLQAEQADSGQPATLPESKSEDSEQPQPEEERSR